MNNVYVLNINSNACNYEIWINDFRADIQTSDHSAYYDLPINQWLSGEFIEINAIVKPLANKKEIYDDAYLKILISACDTSGNAELVNCNIINSISLDSFKDLKKQLGTPLSIYVEKKTFKPLKLLENTYTLLDNSSQDIFSLQKLYSKVFQLFSEKNEAALLELLNPKIKHYAFAYSRTISEEMLKTKTILADLFSKKIAPMDFSNFSLKYYDNKRICCLEDEDGDQPLFFTDDIDSLLVFYPIFFGKLKDSAEWKIVL